jgi:hypothetical protein
MPTVSKLHVSPPSERLQIQISFFTHFLHFFALSLGCCNLHYTLHAQYYQDTQLPLAHGMKAEQVNSLLTSPLDRGIQVHAPAALPSPPTSLNKKLDAPQSQCGRFGEEKYFSRQELNPGLQAP